MSKFFSAIFGGEKPKAPPPPTDTQVEAGKQQEADRIRNLAGFRQTIFGSMLSATPTGKQKLGE